MSVPAGWYADPYHPGYQRWWDGNVWTAATNPPQPPQPSPAVAQPSTHDVSALEKQIRQLRGEYDDLRKQVVETSDAMILQEVGLYEYSHPLDSAPAYRDLLAAIETDCKKAIKSGTAVTSTKKWIINGSDKDGAKMVGDLSKLMLRAYNNEAETVLRALKPYKLDAAIERLEKLRVSIAKLGSSMKLAITDPYHALRIRELKLTADYLAKLAEERERERDAREQLRDEKRTREQFEAEQERLEKEQSHFENLLRRMREMGNAEGVLNAEASLADVREALDGVMRRAANIRAGYVYVISNIGAFGESVVKIGLTRRLEPMERVYELGSASVPFRFDVHALIFSEDAVGLETALHHEFASKRVNLVNHRREFFYIKPRAVREALLRLRGDLLEFHDSVEALEWRQSENTRHLSLPS